MSSLNPKRYERLRAPFSVCLWITDYCNLACKYCYAMPFSGRKMETERLLRLIEECSEMAVFDITLAGGEPLLHPEILRIVDHAMTHTRLRVGVLTNGLPLTQAMARELAAITTPDRFLIQVSLDSHIAVVNNMSRGRGRDVVANIHAIEGLNLDLQIACVLNKNNIGTAHLLIDQFYPLVKRFHFLNMQRTTRALGYSELLLDDPECKDFWHRLNDHRKLFPPDLLLPSLRVHLRSDQDSQAEPDFRVHEKASFDCPSCTAGWTHLNVDADFNVLGCDIAKDHTQMGNLRYASLDAVWRSEAADAVRLAALPACWKIPDETGRNVHRLAAGTTLSRAKL
jgi:MoaA/NifB/PqqE/SkfB family radical SAM enzyme